MEQDINSILAENEKLKAENQMLLSEIKVCRDEICSQIEVVSAIKKELRRNEVQLNSLKTENEEFKRKFAMIENNAIGRFLLKIYRFLREMKNRRG